MELKRKSDILVTEENKSVFARITKAPDTDDCIISEQKSSSRTKGTYDIFKLFVIHDKVIKEIPNLFNKDLNELIDNYGGNTKNWVNLPIKVTCKQKGEYFTYCIEHTKEFEEEELKV